MGLKHDDACLQKAADDEPIFVLRAQDKTAPATVRAWIFRQLPDDEDSLEHGTTIYDDRITANPKLREARELADRMEAWQRANPGRVKMPD